MQPKIQSIWRRAGAFLRKNAYGVTLGACLTVIIATAVYVRVGEADVPSQPEPTPPFQEIAAGAQDAQVERLSDVIGTTALPGSTTAAPLSIAYTLGASGGVWPLAGPVLREFDAQNLVYMPTMARYELHRAMDIAGEAGEAVAAPMSGTVRAVYTDALWGGTIVVTHPDGMESTLCGVRADVQTGAAVRAGDRIGTLEESIPYERSEGAHIHWMLTRDGAAVNPREMTP